MPLSPAKKGLIIRSGRLLGIVATVLVGAILLVSLLGPVTRNVEGLTIRAGLELGRQGRTVVEIPPFGSLRAATHPGPLQLTVTLVEVQPEAFSQVLLSDQGYRVVVEAVRADLEEIMLAFGLRQVVLGGLGGALLVWVLWRLRVRQLALVCACGMLLTGSMLGYEARSYDLSAFREPEYQGAVAAAPKVLHLAEDILGQVDEMRETANLVVGNIQTLSGQVEKVARAGTLDTKDMRRVLIISDLHSNPVGFQFAGDIARQFDVDAIIDAGDLTDFGSPLEVQSAAAIRSFGVPYIFAAGNHDTAEVTSFIRSLPNGHVLDNSRAAIGDLQVLGSPDPLAASPLAVASTESEEEFGLERQEQELDAAFSDGSAPDIVVTHDSRASDGLIGRARVIVNGHTHRVDVRATGTTVVLNPGTAGAAGIRGLDGTNALPYSAILTYWDGDNLVYVDIIKYDPLVGGFSVERQVLDIANEPPTSAERSPDQMQTLSR